MRGCLHPVFSGRNLEPSHVRMGSYKLREIGGLMTDLDDLLLELKSQGLSRLEAAVIDKAERVLLRHREGLFTTNESRHQLWAITDVLIAVEPNSRVYFFVKELESQNLLK